MMVTVSDDSCWKLEHEQVLFAEVDGTIHAVSNKCSHLGLPLVGKVRARLVKKL
jgi:nitrite reductase/ring-hydroxylating ferredoxin subunit